MGACHHNHIENVEPKTPEKQKIIVIDTVRVIGVFNQPSAYANSRKKIYTSC